MIKMKNKIMLFKNISFFCLKITFKRLDKKCFNINYIIMNLAVLLRLF